MVGRASVRGISAARPHKVISRIYPSASGQLVHINFRSVAGPLMGFDRRKNIEILRWYRDFQLRAVRLLGPKVTNFIKVRCGHVLKNLLQ